jgi:hypothetical protein
MLKKKTEYVMWDGIFLEQLVGRNFMSCNIWLNNVIIFVQIFHTCKRAYIHLPGEEQGWLCFWNKNRWATIFLAMHKCIYIFADGRRSMYSPRPPRDVGGRRGGLKILDRLFSPLGIACVYFF